PARPKHLHRRSLTRLRAHPIARPRPRPSGRLRPRLSGRPRPRLGRVRGRLGERALMHAHDRRDRCRRTGHGRATGRSWAGAATPERSTEATSERSAEATAGTGARPPRRTGTHARERSAGSLPTARARRRYWAIMAGLVVTSAAVALGLLAWDNPMPITDDGFWLIAQLRMKNLVVLAIVALSQAFATVAFQTVTNNRIITPSIMGFESLYVAIQTGAMYFFGVTAIVDLKGLTPFAIQLVVMV